MRVEWRGGNSTGYLPLGRGVYGDEDLSLSQFLEHHQQTMSLIKVRKPDGWIVLRRYRVECGEFFGRGGRGGGAFTGAVTP